MMHRDHRRYVWVLIAVFLLCSAVMSEVLAPSHEKYIEVEKIQGTGDYRNTTGANSKLAGTTFQTLIPTLLGIREVLASLMWVRADDYFHRGEYRPIISMVRQITAIDPHQLDVYATGAWHMAYNFMDKRLIADGVEFLEEGCKNNDSVYDLFFELGYMHYDKTKNYPEAVRSYRNASQRGTVLGKKIPPSYVRHQLAHAMEKMGDIDQALVQWEDNLRKARELEKQGEAVFAASGVNTAAARHNLYITARRRNERLAALAERERNGAEALRLWQANVALARDWLKESPGHPDVSKDLTAANVQVERLQAGKLQPVEPSHITLKFTVTRTAPRKLVIEGNADVLNLSRVHVRFQDKGYTERIKGGFNFKMSNCTLEYDNVSVRQGKFKWDLDLNKDPADMERPPSDIYPLKADEYELSVTYNPRAQAAFIQDRYGWSGEGLTSNPEFVREDDSRAGIINGKRYPLRTITRSLILKKEDVLGAGKKVLYRAS